MTMRNLYRSNNALMPGQAQALREQVSDVAMYPPRIREVPAFAEANMGSSNRGSYARYLQPQEQLYDYPQGTWETHSLYGFQRDTTPRMDFSQPSYLGAYTETAPGLGHIENIFESPMDQVRQAIAYTVQKKQREGNPQEIAKQFNQVQAIALDYIWKNHGDFMVPNSGKFYPAPPSAQAAKSWVGFIDLMSAQPMLTEMQTLYPQVKAIRDNAQAMATGQVTVESETSRPDGAHRGKALLGLLLLGGFVTYIYQRRK